MDTAKLVEKLDDYRKKQVSLAASWKKIGKKTCLNLLRKFSQAA